jgi:MFS family permease
MSSSTSDSIRAQLSHRGNTIFFASLMFFLVALFLGYEMAMQVSPGVMVEALRRDLHLSAAQLGWMSGYYFIPYTLMQFPAGLLFDRFKVRLVVIIPLLICASGAYVFSLANSGLEAALARVLMGLGGAYAFIAVLVVADDVFPSRHFAMLAGFAQLLAALGALAGVAPLQPVVNSLGWRTTMQVIALLGFLLALLIWLFVRYDRSVDDASKPMPIRQSLKIIVKNKQTWVVAVYATCSWAPMAAFASLWGKQYLILSHQLLEMDAAWVVSLMWLGIGLGSPLLGWWSDWIKSRKLPLVLTSLLGLLSFSAILLFPQLPVRVLGGLIFLAGVACSGQVLSFAVVKDNNKAANHAAAIGFNNMAVVIAGLIFQPLIGELIDYHAGARALEVVQYTAQDYYFGIAVIPIVYAVGLLISLCLIKETKCEYLCEN